MPFLLLTLVGREVTESTSLRIALGLGFTVAVVILRAPQASNSYNISLCLGWGWFAREYFSVSAPPLVLGLSIVPGMSEFFSMPLPIFPETLVLIQCLLACMVRGEGVSGQISLPFH